MSFFHEKALSNYVCDVAHISFCVFEPLLALLPFALFMANRIDRCTIMFGALGRCHLNVALSHPDSLVRSCCKNDIAVVQTRPRAVKTRGKVCHLVRVG